MAQVISGFPGVGKTHFCAATAGVSDSDSSHFSWLPYPGERQRDPQWPLNYIGHIKRRLRRPEVSYILVSSHQEVRDALVAEGISFVLVYPAPELREEYIQRYIDRGNAPDFVTLLEANYTSWIEGLQHQAGCDHRLLQSGQYLSDVIARNKGR